MHDFHAIMYWLATISMATTFKRPLPALMCLLETGFAAIAGGWGDLCSDTTIFCTGRGTLPNPPLRQSGLYTGPHDEW